MWGDQSETRSIFIDDKEFRVGSNLWNALSHLQHRPSSLPIWIDAICINQEDISERNSQLRMMSHIYFRAKRVLVWLGAEYEKYQQFFLMERLFNVLQLPQTRDVPLTEH